MLSLKVRLIRSPYTHKIVYQKVVSLKENHRMILAIYFRNQMLVYIYRHLKKIPGDTHNAKINYRLYDRAFW